MPISGALRQNAETSTKSAAVGWACSNAYSPPTADGGTKPEENPTLPTVAPFDSDIAESFYPIVNSAGAPVSPPMALAADPWLTETSRYPELLAITNSSPGPHSA